MMITLAMSTILIVLAMKRRKENERTRQDLHML